MARGTQVLWDFLRLRENCPPEGWKAEAFTHCFPFHGGQGMPSELGLSRKSRTNCVCNEIYYNKLGYMTMEPDKSQDPLGGPAGWRPRRSQCFHSILKVRKRQCTKFKGLRARRVLTYLGEGQPFYSSQAFGCLDGAHPHYGGPFSLSNLSI